MNPDASTHQAFYFHVTTLQGWQDAVNGRHLWPDIQTVSTAPVLGAVLGVTAEAAHEARKEAGDPPGQLVLAVQYRPDKVGDTYEDGRQTFRVYRPIPIQDVRLFQMNAHLMNRYIATLMGIEDLDFNPMDDAIHNQRWVDFLLAKGIYSNVDRTLMHGKSKSIPSFSDGQYRSSYGHADSLLANLCLAGLCLLTKRMTSVTPTWDQLTPGQIQWYTVSNEIDNREEGLDHSHPLTPADFGVVDG